MTRKNLAYFSISNSPGTSGNLTVSTAVDALHVTLGAADDGGSYSTRIFETGVGSEIRKGCTYTHGTTTLTRGTLESSTDPAGAALDFTSAAKVQIVASAADETDLDRAAKGLIRGLQMTWNSAASISVGVGAAYIESTGRILQNDSTLTASGLSLTANTWYHVYFYDNAGTPAIEVVTTAPATAFYAKARSKTGDTTRRYVGSVRASATNTLEKFNHDADGGFIAYRDAVKATPFRVLSSGTATSSTAVSAAAVVPVSSDLVLVKISNTDASINLTVGSGADTQNAATTGYIIVAGTVRTVCPCPVDSSQQFAYAFASSPSGAGFIDVQGYWYGR